MTIYRVKNTIGLVAIPVTPGSRGQRTFFVRSRMMASAASRRAPAATRAFHLEKHGELVEDDAYMEEDTCLPLYPWTADDIL